MITDYLSSLSSLLRQVDADAVALAVTTLKNAHAVYVCGNGGSAAIASHFATDANVISLADNTPVMTRIANDYGYERVFAVQLAQVYRIEPGDALLALSVSGKSENVVNAVDYVNQARGATVAFTGEGGGRLARMVQVCVRVPSEEYELAEDVFAALCHLAARRMKEVR